MIIIIIIINLFYLVLPNALKFESDIYADETSSDYYKGKIIQLNKHTGCSIEKLYVWIKF